MKCRSCASDLTDGSKFCVHCGAVQAAPAAERVEPDDARVGTTIEGKYRLDARIGAGGMATVFRATRLLIGDSVAVKILHAEQLREPQAAERFRREAQAAPRLKHPNSVAIYDFGVSDAGMVYLVMEFVEGQNLRSLVKEQGPLFPSGAGEILAQICGALNEAHEQHVVHRDIKPDNILVTTTPTGVRVKVLDFGIARISDTSSLGNLTQTGSVMGTPHYMSPEQCLGEELDGRSDIYSLGIVLYEMLTGVVPFNSPTSMAIAVHHVNTPPAPLRVLNASVPPAVEAVVMRSLEKRRDARPQTAAAFASEFSAAVAGTVGRVAAREPLPQSPAMMPTVQMQAPWSAGHALPPSVPSPVGPHATSQPHRIRRPFPFILAGAAALIVGVVGVMWLLSNDRTSSPPSDGSVATNSPAPTSTTAPLESPGPAPSASPIAPAVTHASPPPASSARPQAAAPVSDPPPGDEEPARDRGDLTIKLLPGSTVQLDGANAGTAGEDGLLTLSRLRPGRHLLIVHKDRYQDVEQTITVVAGRSEVIEIQPVPITGGSPVTAGAPPKSEGEGLQILDLTASSLEVEPGQVATLRVKASDSGPDPLRYTWTTTAGTVAGSGVIAQFRPPPADPRGSSATVTVTARNSRGLEARKDIVIKVKPRAPVAPAATGGMRRSVYPLGSDRYEVMMESSTSRPGAGPGQVDAELTAVDGIWQVTSLQGELPGMAVVITPECKNCQFLGIVEPPNEKNGFRRIKFRVQPLSPQQSMGVVLSYTPVAKKEVRNP